SSGNFTTICLSQGKFGTGEYASIVSGKIFPNESSASAVSTELGSLGHRSKLAAKSDTRPRCSVLKLLGLKIPKGSLISVTESRAAERSEFSCVSKTGI